MPSVITAYGRQLMLSSFFGKSVDVVPDEMFVALTRYVGPSITTGDALQEPGAGYARVPIDMTTDNWTISNQSTAICMTEIRFPVATGDWGLIAGWALCTSVISGMVVMLGTLNVSMAIENGDEVYIPAQAIQVSLRD